MYQGRVMARPKYSVTVTFGIGSYIGNWTGDEPKMEEEYTFLCRTFDKEYAEQMYRKIVAKHEKTKMHVTHGDVRKCLEGQCADCEDK